MNIPVNKVKESPDALREVKRDDPGFQGLVASIREKGFIGAISVREREHDGEKYYEIVDGIQRFYAAKDNGFEDIPAEINNLSDEDSLDAQIMANYHGVDTKPVEYARHLRRILDSNEYLTESQLAKKLGMSSAWLRQQLGLANIQDEKIKDLIEEGKINLSNAYALAKLPAEEQPEYLDSALEQSPQEFVPTINSRVKQRKDERKADVRKSQEFQPTAYLRKLSEIRKELDSPKIGKKLIKDQGVKNLIEVWELAIQWVLNIDPNSVEYQKTKHEQRQKQQEEQEQKKQEERKKKEETLGKG